MVEHICFAVYIVQFGPYFDPYALLYLVTPIRNLNMIETSTGAWREAFLPTIDCTIDMALTANYGTKESEWVGRKAFVKQISGTCPSESGPVYLSTCLLPSKN